MRRGRPTRLIARVLGIALLIPGLLHVPLPRVEYHVVRHRHGPGQVCPKHDHLLRWHPQLGEGEGEGVAVLHWHWLLPGAGGLTSLDAPVRTMPAIHAHDDDHEPIEAPAGPVFVPDTADREIQGALALSHGPTGALACWLAPPPPVPPEIDPSSREASGGPPADPPRARLVRRNC